MTVREMQEEIMRLKKEKDVCILAHTYQSHDVVEVADFTGDSFQLSMRAKNAPQKNILMCGVRFMAETVKILSPQKNVYLSREIAGCPMAEQLTPGQVLDEKAKYPEAMIVAYVNTTAELKAVSDVCVTSSSAVEIVEKLPAKDVIFVPDANLGAYVAENCPDKRVHLMCGCCPVHASVTSLDVAKAKAEHPNAELLVHPECKAEVLACADYIGSTAGIMDYAEKSACEEFIIGTEISVAEHLAYLYPEKKFYPLSKRLICPNMKSTTLPDVYHFLKDGGTPVELEEKLMKKARSCIDKMLELGK